MPTSRPATDPEAADRSRRRLLRILWIVLAIVLLGVCAIGWFFWVTMRNGYRPA